MTRSFVLSGNGYLYLASHLEENRMWMYLTFISKI